MKAKESGSVKSPTTPVKPSKPVQAQKTQAKPQSTRAPKQFGGVASGTGSRVPESAIRADESLGKTSQERSFNQHYGVLAPIAGEKFRVSQLQGNVPQRINYAYGAHTGVDFAAPIGTEVRGIKEGGVVKFSGNAGAYGNRVVIEYPDGTQSAFNHLDSADVTPGQRIEKGQVFAKSGNTGRSTGAHLDLQSIDKNDVAAAPDKVFNKTSVYGATQFDDSWKGAQSGVNNFSANIGKSPVGGGTIMASGGETSGSGSRSDSFGTGTSSSGTSGFMGQQVNLGALNQTSMRGTGLVRGSKKPSSSTTPTEFTPAQTTNPGTTTSIKSA